MPSEPCASLPERGSGTGIATAITHRHASTHRQNADTLTFSARARDLVELMRPMLKLQPISFPRHSPAQAQQGTAPRHSTHSLSSSCSVVLILKGSRGSKSLRSVTILWTWPTSLLYLQLPSALHCTDTATLILTSSNPLVAEYGSGAARGLHAGSAGWRSSVQ